MAAASEQGYPEDLEADVILRDGRICHIRPITPDDRAALAAFHESLSEETVYYRFFAPYPRLSEKDLDRFTGVDYADRMAFVALDNGELIGVGRYDRIDRASAEIAFTIGDEHQGRGIGSILLEHLAAAAREHGITRFEAEVLPTNRRMLATFEEAGYTPASTMADGVVSLHFDINPTASSLAVMQAREQRAEARSIGHLLAPQAVALIGASRREATVGNLLLRNLRDGDFQGPVYAIHPEADSIEGVACYRSVPEVPGPVDLAIIAVPAADVLDAVAACGEARVRGAVVVSSGFAETGLQGQLLQDRLVAQARDHGLRIIGPNALGIINTDPHVRLNASLVTGPPHPGRIGFFAQTGALGQSLLAEAQRRGLGVSTFVSAGNRIDVSANDLLQYWEDDEATGVVMLYLESVGNPRKFTRVARRLSATKPVVAVRSGRSSQALPLGHRVRRTALPPQAVDAMFEQAGVMQVDTVSELFDVAALLSLQPLPKGDRVAIVGNSDAVAVLAADAVEAEGLQVSGEVRAVAHDAAVGELTEVVQRAVSDPDTDAILLLHVPVLQSEPPELLEEILRVSRDSTKPVLAVALSLDRETDVLTDSGTRGMPGRGSVPVFREVRPAVAALATVVEHARWLDEPKGEVPELAGIDFEAAREIVDDVLRKAAGGMAGDAQIPIPADRLRSILECYGIDLWVANPVVSEAQAVEVADETGYPVVLKSALPELEHRPELGAVRLNLENEAAVRAAYLSLIATLPEEAQKRIVLQRQAPAGVSVLIEKQEDALFGPVVSFGLAGDVPRLLDDRAWRIPPLSDTDVRELLSSPKASPVLFGYRGAPEVDVQALAELIHRMARLADDLPEITRLELHPVIASPRGAAVVGASAVCGPAAARQDSQARRMVDRSAGTNGR